MVSKKKTKQKGPMSLRLKHPEKLLELRHWFAEKYRRVVGHAHPQGLPPAGLIVNHAIKTLHSIETDPDACVASVKGSIRNMNALLMLALEREAGRLLTGLEIKHEVTRSADGGLDWVVYMDEDQSAPTHGLRVGPEIFRREDGENRDLLVRPERDFTIN